ncbi:MAG TPA: hypothetical protein DCM27_06600 [Rhodospirillaceae bacterium]|nr:hypothetical protein [Rhodospirillaceae bacterium]
MTSTALKDLKALAAEVTKPRERGGNPINSRLPRFSANDPVLLRLENAERNGSPDIDNSGRGALRVRNTAQEINAIYETEDDKKQAERDRNGGLTKTEENRAIAWLYHTDPIADIAIITAAGYTAAKESYIGRDGQKYTEVYDEHGKLAYLDNGTMCVRATGGLSATTRAQANDDLIDDTQKFNITHKVDADGNSTERTPEDANFQLAMARMDNQYTKVPLQINGIDRIIADVTGATAFSSAAPVGIITNIAPAKPFSAASAPTNAFAGDTSQSIMLATPQPWEKQPGKLPAPLSPTPSPEPSL